MTNALKSILDRDSDMLAARRFADQMIALLTDYIPDNSRRDAWDLLAKTAYENKFELTTFAMRKQYEAWKSVTLDERLLAPSDHQKDGVPTKGG